MVVSSPTRKPPQNRGTYTHIVSWGIAALHLWTALQILIHNTRFGATKKEDKTIVHAHLSLAKVGTFQLQIISFQASNETLDCRRKFGDTHTTMPNNLNILKAQLAG